jgi:hypothetical protein
LHVWLSNHAATKDEIVTYVERCLSRKEQTKQISGSMLAVRTYLSPVDMYCYLKARFGKPNGFQNFLRKDDSDNWIHWEFMLKAGKESILIYGTSREIHFLLSEQLTDNDWRDFINNIKSDYKRIGNEKSAVLKSLEKWVVFPNKFMQVAGICADLHFDITENIDGFQSYRHNFSLSENRPKEQEELLKKISHRSNVLYRSCLELSLITPVFAEAFINMAILVLCKKEIKANQRQFESFIRSNIDVKALDLYYKCDGFIKQIDKDSDVFKNFLRVMNKRNHIIHGNIDPVREQIETVYFDGTRPLFVESGDHIGKFQEALERLHQPQTVLKDYLDTYSFLIEIASCLSPELEHSFWHIMKDSYPGYDVDRNKAGALFPNYVVGGYMEGLKFDDELV